MNSHQQMFTVAVIVPGQDTNSWDISDVIVESLLVQSSLAHDRIPPPPNSVSDIKMTKYQYAPHFYFQAFFLKII